MRVLIVSCFLFLLKPVQAEEVLIFSSFTRLNADEFKIYSEFHSGSGSCFPYQTRTESISNDTLFLKLVFETRFPLSAFGCNRLDTMTRTINDAGIHYINVSTGIIVENDTNPNIADTLWSMFDSTFNATLEINDLLENDFEIEYDQQYLTTTGAKTIESMQLLDLNGKALILQQGNKMNVSLLSCGIYLLRIFSSGSIHTILWYKE